VLFLISREPSLDKGISYTAKMTRADLLAGVHQATGLPSASRSGIVAARRARYATMREPADAFMVFQLDGPPATGGGAPTYQKEKGKGWRVPPRSWGSSPIAGEAWVA
jgi:hypothetical protein